MRTIMRTHRKTAAALLGAAILSSGSLAAPAQAQNEPEWQDVLSTAICLFGNQRRVSAATVAQNARSRGYTNVRNVTYRTRGSVKINACGYYEANAQLNGREYLLYARESDGQIVGRKNLGQAQRRDRRNRADMTEAEIVTALHRQDYRGINSLRYIKRGNTDYYQARGLKDGQWYRLQIEDATGQVLDRKGAPRWQDNSNRAELDSRDIRHLLRGQGYRRIRDIEYRDRGSRDFYTAQAHKDGQWYRLVVSDFTGEVARARETDGPGRRDLANRAELTEEQIRDRLEEQGYIRIRRVKYTKTEKGDYYEARANSGGTRYALLVDDSTGKVLERDEERRRYRRDLGDRAELDREEISEFVKTQGYGRIEAVRYITRYGSDWYEVRARRGGTWHTLIVTDHKPKIVARF